MKFFSSGQGTLLANHHTPLISHTADDIITTLTGVYGEKHGQPVANSYGYFRADGSIGFASSLRPARTEQPRFNWNHGDFQEQSPGPGSDSWAPACAASIATEALAGDATTIGQLDGRLNDLTTRRNALAGRMIAILEGAAFDRQSIDADEVERLIAQAQDLLASVR